MTKEVTYRCDICGNTGPFVKKRDESVRRPDNLFELTVDWHEEGDGGYTYIVRHICEMWDREQNTEVGR